MVWFVAAALAAGILGRIGFLFSLLLFVPWLARRERARARHALPLCAVALAFFGYGSCALRMLDEQTACFDRAAARGTGEVPLAGWVSSFPQSTMGRTSFRFTTRIDGERLHVLVRCEEFGIGYGDSLALRARLGPSKRSRRSYVGYLRGRGLAGLVRAPAGGVRRTGGTAGNPLVRHVLWPLHDRIRRDVHRGTGSRAGIPLALLLGERGAIDPRLRAAFRDLGVSHLLALSGLHLGFVAGALLLVLAPMRRRRGAFLVLGLALYVGVVGTIPSLYRAFAMAVVLIAAAALRRPLRPMTSLADAFVLVLLLHPYAFYAIGFQLSFLATFAVLLAVRSIQPTEGAGVFRRVIRYAVSTVWVSIAVQIVAAPLLLHYFGQVSVAAPLATLVLVGPVALMLLATAAAALANLCVPALGPPAFGALASMARMLETAMLTIADWVPEPLRLPEPQPVAFYAGIALFAWRSGRRWVRSIGVALAAIAFIPDESIGRCIAIVIGLFR